MKHLRTLVMLAGVVTGSALVAHTSARAEENFSFSFNTGDVAFAYTDGFWDNDHHWHRWHNEREAREYRERFADHYHGWRHTRDHDHGWRDRDDHDDHDRH